MNPARIPVPADKTITIGKNPQNDIVLSSNLCSRQHAVIRSENGNAHITDTGSTNGTLVNGERISDHSLQHEDKIQIGTCLLTFLQTEKGAEIVVAESPAAGQKPVPDPEKTVLQDDVPDQLLERISTEKKGNTLVLKSQDPSTAFSLNGKTGKDTVLRNGDDIRVGSTRFTLTHGTLIRSSLVSGFRIDVRGLCKTISGRPILHPLSFMIRPGEFVGFLGPSGCGKTTLVKMLTGLAGPTAGRIHYDHFSFDKDQSPLLPLIGFVPQADLVQPELTPREILYYTGRLRLPSRVKDATLQRYIRSTLHLMELGACADTPCGSLSGGQKKRVSIGMEIISQPGVLILDEPTSSLDPALEGKTMEILRRIANGNRTVILTTHSLTRVHLLDRVGIVHEGRLVYFGPPSEVTRYFRVSDFGEIYGKLSEKPAAQWEQGYRDTRKQNPEESTLDAGKEAKANMLVQKRNPLKQFYYLTARYLKILRRDWLHSLILLGQAPLIALLIIMTFGNAINSWSVLFCMTLSCIWFGAVNSVKEFCKEVPLHIRERRAGLHTLPYYFSKLVPLWGFSIIQVLVLQLMIHGAIKLEGSIILQLLNLTFCSFTATCMGLTVSAWSLNTDRALSLLPVLLIPQILFAGAITPFDEMYRASRWMSAGTISRWIFSAAKKINMGLGTPSGEWVALFVFMLIFILSAITFLHRNHESRK